MACKQSSSTKSQGKWLTDCGLVTTFSVDLRAVYKLAFQCTRIISLIVFQFKLLHRRIATNDFLFKIGLHENDHCSFCQSETESLIHLFWFCRKTTAFWQVFRNNLIQEKLMEEDFTLSPAMVLGMQPDTLTFKEQLNFEFLVARFFIWHCKVRKMYPTIDYFTRFLAYFKN